MELLSAEHDTTHSSCLEAWLCNQKSPNSRSGNKIARSYCFSMVNYSSGLIKMYKFIHLHYFDKVHPTSAIRPIECTVMTWRVGTVIHTNQVKYHIVISYPNQGFWWLQADTRISTIFHHWTIPAVHTAHKITKSQWLLHYPVFHPLPWQLFKWGRTGVWDSNSVMSMTHESIQLTGQCPVTQKHCSFLQRSYHSSGDLFSDKVMLS